MKFIKFLALLLSIIIITVIFTGCNQTAKSPFVSSDPVSTVSPSDTAATDPAAVSPVAAELNYAGAYASLDPKTVMLTVNGKDILWDELFYYITYGIYNIESQGGQISDWSAVIQDDVTYRDYVLNTAVNYALHNEAVNYGAKQLSVTLTEQDKADMQTDYDTQVSSAGGEEAFLAILQQGYTNKDIFTMLNGIGYLTKGCFNAMYGADGSMISDQEVADYTADDGYLMAKHIIFITVVEDETGNSTAMTDTDKATVREKAEAVLAELKNYKGDNFAAYFDELMNTNSEDPGGLASYPNGYLFKSGDMVSEFENATIALQVGEFSPALVESKYGYHIIYRLPIDYDAVPISSSGSGTDSLRYITAVNMFYTVADTWLNSLDVIYSEQFNALDPAKIFAVG